jgi:hypothetical protein
LNFIRSIAMSEYSRRIIPLVVVTLLVTTIAAYEVNNLYSTSSTSQTSSSQASALGFDGLLLTASLNASQLAPGQALQVNASIFNTLARTNSVPVADEWPFQGIPLSVLPACDLSRVGSDALGFNVSTQAEAVVLKGDYTMANISSAADIHIPVFGCPEGTAVDHLTFEPSSVQANITGTDGLPTGKNESLGPYSVTGTFTTNGSWDLLMNSKEYPILDYGGPGADGHPPTATPFTPGVYTVGIEDVWGQAVILHFVVK